MVFGQDVLLTPEEEQVLKGQLKELRAQNLSAKKIAEKLKFGEPNSPYENLIPRHVYYYVQYFGLKRKFIREKRIDDAEEFLKTVSPNFRRYYFKWRPNMPQSAEESLRKDGFLLKDPQGTKPKVY